MADKLAINASAGCLDVTTARRTNFDIERYPNGSLQVYVDEARTTYDHLDKGVAVITFEPDEAADFIVALQAWIENLKKDGAT